MAALKIKRVKGHEYFYWRKRVRSHKRLGGDGRLRTVDYLIGAHPIGGNWLPYHLWCQNINLQEYSRAVIRRTISTNNWQHLIDFTIDWEKNKISLKGLIPPLRMTGIVLFGVDCRSKPWRTVREVFQTALNQIIKRSVQIETIIERAAYDLSWNDKYLAEVKKLRGMAKDARLNPDKHKPDADLHLDEYASELESEADKLMQRYLEIVNDKLLVFAPPKQRQQFRCQIISRVEKLAQDQRWLEEYEAKLERSCHSAS